MMLSSDRPRTPLRRLPSEGRGIRSVFPVATETTVRAVAFEEISVVRVRAAVASAPFQASQHEEQKLAEQIAEAERAAYERGRADGKRDTQAELSKLAQRVEGAFAYLHKALAATEVSMSKDSVKLALMIAQKIVRRVVAADAEAVSSTIAAAVETTESTEPLRIVCDPMTAGRLRTQFNDLATTLKVEAVTIEEDAHLETGDFMFYRGSSTLDARLATRLQRIERSLVRELGLEVPEETT